MGFNTNRQEKGVEQNRDSDFLPRPGQLPIQDEKFHAYKKYKYMQLAKFKLTTLKRHADVAKTK